MYDLGSRLKNVRKKRGISQKELAQRVNKSISAISSYETNAQLPPLDVAKDIAVVLNVSIDYLVGTDKSGTFYAGALTPEQAELLDLLLQEFHAAYPCSGKLTQNQIILLQKLIQYFISKQKT